MLLIFLSDHVIQRAVLFDSNEILTFYHSFRDEARYLIKRISYKTDVWNSISGRGVGDFSLRRHVQKTSYQNGYRTLVPN
jgi:hypothetical protein